MTLKIHQNCPPYLFLQGLEVRKHTVSILIRNTGTQVVCETYQLSIFGNCEDRMNMN